MKLPVDLLQKAETEFQKDSAAIADIQADIAKKDALELDGKAHLELRRTMITAAAREPVDLAFERYIGTNDLLPINYLAIGSMQARAVGRIRYFDKREHKTAFATGFMVSPEIMMTNHHVFPVDDVAGFVAMADDATIEFNYEFDVSGKLGEPVVHALDPNAFFHSSKDLDLALVAVRPPDISGRHQLSQQGYLVLNGDLGKAGIGESATIIQHPDGQQKQIALRSNEVVDNSLAEVIVYKSDTAQGSSGAPVFNSEWQVIALHSAGVAKKDQQGNYLDKDDKIIPIIQGSIDEARVVWLSNRGVRISAIMKHLKAAPGVATHPLGQIFSSPAYTDNRSFVALSDPKPLETERNLAQPIASAPAAPSAAPVEIRISIGGGPAVVTSAPASGPALQGAPAIFEVEKKLEDDQDFTTCEGYQAEFLDNRIPMPKPSEKLRKKLAFLQDNPSAYILKYHHYSTMQHAVRRVPVVSAVNVPRKYRYEALGKESRKDNWLRDNRIDYDAQLDDAWYAKSGFDKGHLSRREDAEWGTSMAAAKTAADMTCSYANAAPQVPALNRAIFGYHGKWGTLEQKLLEEGIKLEEGKSSRISIFAGPLFDDDDPVYASVQVALSFFKIVAWYNDDGVLRATAFRLSQERLVGNIEFEELHFDQLLKTEQKPITWIEDRTGLEFPNVLKKADTHE
jgi:endonuclease G